MVYWQLIGGMNVLFILLAVLYYFIGEFKTKRKTFLPLFLILILFTIGFSFRLSNIQSLVDFGFFFTEISYLFTYILFTVALILGQKRYWKRK